MKTVATAFMRRMLRNKKGIDFYVIIVTLVGIFLLGAVIFGLSAKYYKLSSGFVVGTEQFKLLKTYSTAEKALLFVDDSARLALEQATHDSGRKGFYAAVPACGSSGGFSYWAKDIIDKADDCVPKPAQPGGCYPDDNLMKQTIVTYFTLGLGDFVLNFDKVSDVKLPFNYEPFSIRPVVGRTEIVGKSKDAVTIAIPNVKYEVKPSFRESIPVDTIANGKEVIANSQLLVKLNKGDTEKKIDEFNKAKKFEWKLASYTKTGSSCTYNTGTKCSYDCGDDCTTSCIDDCGDGDPLTCCKEETTCVDVFCDGTIKTTVPFDEISSLTSATENQKLLVVDEATGKPEFKNMEYDFGLSWIETGSSSNTCS